MFITMLLVDSRMLLKAQFTSLSLPILSTAIKSNMKSISKYQLKEMLGKT